MNARPATAPAVSFGSDGVPRSLRYGDVYFSREGGLAESRAVFLAGCGLPARWAERRRFTVGELGFGTGLNIVALLDLWRSRRPPDGHLSIFSVEAEPLDVQSAGRALALWPELAPVAAPLLRRWPGRRAGFHRVELPEFAATLDVAVMDAAAALDAWTGHADAWFLDGFAPALNPEIWSEAVMRRLAARSAPGAWAATYTVAGRVRRGLAAAGFAVERRPGFGAKRERLEARAPGEPPPEPAAPTVAIIGAGVAGAALARAFDALGASVRVFEAAAAGAGASGNPAAMVSPRLDAGLAGPARLYAQAFDRATRLYAGLDRAIIARGALRLEATPRDAGRFAKIVAADLFEPGAVMPLSAKAAGEALGEPAAAGLWIRDALVIDPRAVFSAWLPPLRIARVTALATAGVGWRLLDEAGESVAQADVVCLATGADLARLWPQAPVVPVRGQLNWADGPQFAATLAVAWGAYAAPTAGGFMFGATHDRGDASVEPRPGDDARNRAALAERLPGLAARLAGATLKRRASVRASTPDQAPLAGEVAPGLLVLGALGSHGFALAPLLAEHLAATALGAPSPLPAQLAALVAPGRFEARARRRGLVAGRRKV